MIFSKKERGCPTRNILYQSRDETKKKGGVKKINTSV